MKPFYNWNRSPANNFKKWFLEYSDKVNLEKIFFWRITRFQLKRIYWFYRATQDWFLNDHKIFIFRSNKMIRVPKTDSFFCLSIYSLIFLFERKMSILWSFKNQFWGATIPVILGCYNPSFMKMCYNPGYCLIII